MVNEDLYAAVGALELIPRERVWTSVSYCVLDAVWSIGAHYDRVVNPLVRRVAAAHGDERPTCPPAAAPANDPLPLDVFLAAYSDDDALRAVTNNQRTSTRGGIFKASAVRRYAEILVAAGVTGRGEATALLGDTAAVEAVDAKLRRVPGDGVRRDYFWMLVGSDDLVKPDRMVLRFLARHGGPDGVGPARSVLVQLASDLSTTQRRVTPWMVDHAIWRAERSRPH